MAAGHKDYPYTQKTIVNYMSRNPYLKGVSHIAIQTEMTVPYVFATYSEGTAPSPEVLSSDLLIVPIGIAKKLFNFRKMPSLESLLKSK